MLPFRDLGTITIDQNLSIFSTPRPPSSPNTVTYAIASNNSSVNENSSVVFNITTSNISNNTVLYWSTSGVSGTINNTDFTDSSVSGAIFINNNSAALTRSISNDLTTEGTESFVIHLRTSSVSGPIVATSNVVTINDTSTTPTIVPTYSIVPTSSQINENNSVTFNVNTTNVTNGTTLFWTTSTVSGTINISDFTDRSLSGSFIVNSNVGSITRTLSADVTTEGTESFAIQLRTTSAVGPVVAVSAPVIVYDTSTGPDPNYILNFFTDSTTGKVYNLYRTNHYPISALITGITNNPIEGTMDYLFLNAFKDSANILSRSLSGSNINTAQNFSTLYNGEGVNGNDTMANPLQTIPNKGIIMVARFYNNPSDNVLGYAGPTRWRVQAADYKTNSAFIPQEGVMSFNLGKFDYNTASIPVSGFGPNVNLVYYVFLHEFLHALGIGTVWHINGTTELYKSHIVGAGDTSPNAQNNDLTKNFFYTSQSTSTIRPTIDPSANYNLAFYNSLYFSPLVTPSYAVTEYNSAFGTNLTAIPIENESNSAGSHWEEGETIFESTFITASAFGLDNRNYYGSSPAPGMDRELMSPQAESGGTFMPFSRITLGSLADIGYTVSYAEADQYKATDFVIKYINSSTNLQTGLFTNNINTPILEQGWNGTSGSSIKLRRGITYRFAISSTIPIKITQDSSGVTLVTDGIINNNISSGTITYTPPLTVPNRTQYWIYGGSSSARTRIILL